MNRNKQHETTSNVAKHGLALNVQMMEKRLHQVVFVRNINLQVRRPSPTRNGIDLSSGLEQYYGQVAWLVLSLLLTARGTLIFLSIS